MKRKITISIALVLSITVLLLTSSDSPVEAQNQVRTVADTGFVKLGPNQKLRVSIMFDGFESGGVAFRRLVYAPGGCVDGVCKSVVASQTTTSPIALAAGESAFFDIPAEIDGVRAVVLTNNRKARVNASIIDAVTGEVDSFITDWIIDPIS